jgi:hypothetical protein
MTRKIKNADVAELADAQDSGSCVRKDVEVRFLSSALFFSFAIPNSIAQPSCPDSPARFAPKLESSSFASIQLVKRVFVTFNSWLRGKNVVFP